MCVASLTWVSSGSVSQTQPDRLSLEAHAVPADVTLLAVLTAAAVADAAGGGGGEIPVHLGGGETVEVGRSAAEHAGPAVHAVLAVEQKSGS